MLVPRQTLPPLTGIASRQAKEAEEEAARAAAALQADLTRDSPMSPVEKQLGPTDPQGADMELEVPSPIIEQQGEDIMDSESHDDLQEHLEEKVMVHQNLQRSLMVWISALNLVLRKKPPMN